MRVVFMGSDPFSLPVLEQLSQSGRQLSAVVTQPDKPKGRGLAVAAGEVKEKALSLGIPVLQPDRLKDQFFKTRLTELSPDLIVVAAFGKLIPPEILKLPPFGCINVHPSLLPKYRGASPVEAALMAGEKTTGVTIFFMDEGWDTGDIILSRETPILPEETGGELREKLARLGAELLLKTLVLLEQNQAPRLPQKKEEGTYAPLLKKENLKILWPEEGEKIKDFIRALSPHPGAVTVFRGKSLKVYQAKLFPELTQKGKAGEIVGLVKGEGPLVASKSGGLILTRLKPEGKNLIKGEDFLNGYQPRIGEILG